MASGFSFDLFNSCNYPSNVVSSVNRTKEWRPETVAYTSPSFWANSRKLFDCDQCPNYVLMKRNEPNSALNLNTISPFLVSKTIKMCTGPPKSMQLLRDGTLLINTTCKQHADRLCALTQLTDDIHVKVIKLHNVNQTVKGTVFCRELIGATDAEIIEGLEEYDVIDIYRMKRTIDGSRVDFGLFVLTFNRDQLPRKIQAGYQLLEVRQYIPNPKRCLYCQRYSSGAKCCKECAVSANVSTTKDSAVFLLILLY